jgi:hypothetical protein
MTQYSIKIPEQVYVGFQGRRSQDEVPLGFMTPYNDDEAGQRRRATVDNWARGYGNSKTFNSVILENKPMIGFKIGRAIRRSGGWNGSGASYVRIEDPRGFELEITIENLVMCMSDNLLDDGEIIAECVWGRDGNRNILLPTNSEPYKNSVVLRTKVAAVIPLKEVTVGDEVELITGEKGIYLGSLLPLQLEGSLQYRTGKIEIVDSTKRYVLKVMRNGVPFLVGRSSIKVIEVTKKVEKKLTVDQVEEEIIAAMTSNPFACEDASANNYREVLGWTFAGYKIGTMTTVDVTEAEIKKLIEENGGHRAKANSFIETMDGKNYHAEDHINFVMDRNNNPDRYYWANIPQTHSNGYVSNQTRMQARGFVVKEVTLSNVYNTVESDNYGHNIDIAESDVKRFFNVQFEITSKTGNKMQVRI